MNKIIAVHHFHNAMEIALKTICSHYSISLDEALGFPKLIEKIDAHPSLKDKDLKLPQRQRLQELNKVRNLAQHNGQPPSDPTLNECRVFGEQALRETCISYFGIDFDQLSLVDLISSQELRRLLKGAQLLAEKERYSRSVVLSYVAFVVASEVISSNLTQDYSLPIHLHDPYTPSIGQDQKNEFILSRMRTLERNMVLLQTGIQATDFKKFLNLVPAVEFLAGGDLDHEDLGDNGPSKDDALWLLEFVVDAIIKWQTQGFVPSLRDFYRPAYEKLCKEAE
jgi:hypothetical protein